MNALGTPCAVLLLSVPLFGAAGTYDGFDHTIGERLGKHDVTYPGQTAPTGQLWYAGGIFGTNSTQDAMIFDDNLSITGLMSSVGHSVQLLAVPPSTGVVDRIAIGPPNAQGNPQVYTSGEVYYSLILRVRALTDPNDTGTQITLNGAFIAGFNNRVPTELNASGTNRAGTRLHVALHDTDNTKFRIGLRPDSSTIPVVFDPRPRAPGPDSDPVFIVGRYTFVDGATNNDLHDLWVNPPASTFGAAAAPTYTDESVNFPLTATGMDLPAATDNLGGPPAVYCFFVRQNDIAPYSVVVDEVRVGLTWADVTPPETACNDPRFDADGDHDVDLDDFGAFQRCWALPATTPGCQCFDKDGSGTISAQDYVSFQGCAAIGGAGSGVQANPACDD
jgi:hypothetical protein